MKNKIKKDKVTEIYTVSVMIVNLINIILIILVILQRSKLIDFLINWAGFAEIIIFILSFILIIYLLLKKEQKIKLILPCSYLIGYSGLVIYSGITNQGFKIDPLDFSYISNIIGILLNLIFYLAQIIWGIFILRNEFKVKK